jgi:hypothetical protein
MGDSGGGNGVVQVLVPGYRARGQCSCGWVGRPRLLVSSAKVDAMIHAAQWNCELSSPLTQHDLFARSAWPTTEADRSAAETSGGNQLHA